MSLLTKVAGQATVALAERVLDELKSPAVAAAQPDSPSPVPQIDPLAVYIFISSRDLKPEEVKAIEMHLSPVVIFSDPLASLSLQEIITEKRALSCFFNISTPSHRHYLQNRFAELKEPRFRFILVKRDFEDYSNEWIDLFVHLAEGLGSSATVMKQIPTDCVKRQDFVQILTRFSHILRPKSRCEQITSAVVEFFRSHN